MQQPRNACIRVSGLRTRACLSSVVFPVCIGTYCSIELLQSARLPTAVRPPGGPGRPLSGRLSVLSLARRAPRRPDTGVARVPFIALHPRRRALPPAVRGHRAHPPGAGPLACHQGPRWGTGAGGALRERPLPPCPVQPAAPPRTPRRPPASSAHMA